MTAAYLVTERETDVALLRKLLPTALTSNLVFYATNGRSSVYSAAGTLLSDRSCPVVIVVDADTQDPNEIQEKSISQTPYCCLPPHSMSRSKFCLVFLRSHQF